jgi:hypothetical protein
MQVSLVDYRLTIEEAVSHQPSAISQIACHPEESGSWATKDLSGSFVRTPTGHRKELPGCFAALSMTEGYTIHHSLL